MVKAHSPINWENEPSQNTPINEANLNKMDSTIGILDDRIITLDVEKLDKTTANNMVKSISFDESTGIFTITLLNGSTTTIDTKLEKIAINFGYNPETQKITLELIDGTTQEIDLSALITHYEFVDSDTIGWEVTTDGKVKAKVLDGSITEDMLQPNYLAEIKVETEKSAQSMANAKISENNAKQSELNAKASEEQALEYSNNAQPLAQSVSGNNPTATNSTNAPLIYGKVSGYTEQDGEPTPDNPIDIVGLGDGGTIEVKTCGKNIFGGIKLAQAIVNSGSANVVLDESAGTVTFSHNTNHLDTEKSILFDKFKENTQYTIILKGNNTNNGDKLLYTTNIRVFYSDNSTETITLDTSGDFNIAFVTSENKTVKNVKYVYNDTDRNVLYYNQCGIFEGVITEEEFVEHQETEALIPTSSPFYEGDYIEVYADGTGKIVRENVSYISDGSESGWFLSGIVICLPTLWGKLDSTIGYADKLRHTSKYANATNLFDTQYNQVRVYANGKTLAEFKAELAENPIHFVIKLATPIIEPLTAEQVAEFMKLQTFKGVTHINADGEISVRYYCNNDSGETVGMLHEMVEEVGKVKIENIQLNFTLNGVGGINEMTLAYHLEGYADKPNVLIGVEMDSGSVEDAEYIHVYSQKVTKDELRISAKSTHPTNTHTTNFIVHVTIVGIKE